jgi:hypothetical protein
VALPRVSAPASGTFLFVLLASVVTMRVSLLKDGSSRLSFNYLVVG